jgi:hypothetical protein
LREKVERNTLSTTSFCACEILGINSDAQKYMRGNGVKNECISVVIKDIKS